MPAGYSHFNVTSLTPLNGIDGEWNVTMRRNATAYDSAPFNASSDWSRTALNFSAWEVVLQRKGNGAVVPQGQRVELEMCCVENPLYEGLTATYPVFKTTLRDQRTAVDEASDEADADGDTAAGNRIIPSPLASQIEIRAGREHAGQDTNLTVRFNITSDLPKDGVIQWIIPDTFADFHDHDDDGAHSHNLTQLVSASANLGEVSMTVYDNETEGRIVYLRRDGQGDVLYPGETVSATVCCVTNPLHEGAIETTTKVTTMRADAKTR